MTARISIGSFPQRSIMVAELLDCQVERVCVCKGMKATNVEGEGLKDAWSRVLKCPVHVASERSNVEFKSGLWLRLVMRWLRPAQKIYCRSAFFSA